MSPPPPPMLMSTTDYKYKSYKLVDMNIFNFQTLTHSLDFGFLLPPLPHKKLIFANIQTIIQIAIVERETILQRSGVRTLHCRVITIPQHPPMGSNPHCKLVSPTSRSLISPADKRWHTSKRFCCYQSYPSLLAKPLRDLSEEVPLRYYHSADVCTETFAAPFAPSQQLEL